MSSRKDDLLKWTNEYIGAENKKEYTSREVSEWAIRVKKLSLSPEKLITIIAEEFARAWKEELFIDPSGNRVRLRHARKADINGKQGTLWENYHTISRENLELSLTQHRVQIVGELTRMDDSAQSYNKHRNTGEPIQIPFDFRPDIAEHRANKEMASSTEPSQPSSQSSGVEQKPTLQSVPSCL